MKNRNLHLSLLFFFQLGAIGTYSPIITLYFTDYLGFSPIQAGIILSLSSIPSIVAPFFSAVIVDRIISSRKFLAIGSIITAILIIIISFERAYVAVLITYFAYMMFLIPSISVVNSLVFHFIDNGDSFPFLRTWGSVGWILSGWLISAIWNITGSQDTLQLALQISALLFLVVIYLTLKLPKIEVDKNKKVTLIPHETVDILKKPEVIIILAIVFLSSTVDKFISYGLPIFLGSNGVAQENLPVILSFAQFPEIVLLLTFTLIIKKFGINKVIVIAFIFQISRFIIFYINGPLYLSIIGSVFHGFIYPLFYAPAIIYLDKFTNLESRAGFHQIFNLIFIGLAGLLGNFMAGLIAQSFTLNGQINFEVFWLIPGVLAIFTLCILLLFFKKYTME